MLFPVPQKISVEASVLDCSPHRSCDSLAYVLPGFVNDCRCNSIRGKQAVRDSILNVFWVDFVFVAETEPAGHGEHENAVHQLFRGINELCGPRKVRKEDALQDKYIQTQGYPQCCEQDFCFGLFVCG